MRRRSIGTLILLVAIAITLSLVVALAPDAGAQGSVAAPDSSTDWTRYNIPASQDLEAACCGKAKANGFTNKRCCITIVPSCPPPGPDTVIGSEPATVKPSGGDTRWFCGGFLNGY